jgi:hypothetical protein
VFAACGGVLTSILRVSVSSASAIMCSHCKYCQYRLGSIGCYSIFEPKEVLVGRPAAGTKQVLYMLHKYTDEQLYALQDRCFHLLMIGGEMGRSNARVALELILREVERRKMNHEGLGVCLAHGLRSSGRPGPNGYVRHSCDSV